MRKHKRFAVVILTLMLGLSMPLPAFAGWNVSSLKDVSPSDWFYTAVEYSYEHSIDIGLYSDRFAPNDDMTRERFIRDLGKVHGIDEQSFDCGRFDRYQDVDSFSSFAPYIMWGTVHGVIAGVGGERFDPQGSLTREQLATIIARYLEIFFPEALEPLKQSVVNDVVFVDADQVSTWAQDSVELLRQIGLLHGDHIRRVNPQGVLTRAEAVTVLMNLREAILPWLEQKPEIAKIEIQAEGIYLDSPTTDVSIIAYDAEGNEILHADRWCHVEVALVKNDPARVSYDAVTGTISVLNYDELETTDAEPFSDELWECPRLANPYQTKLIGFVDVAPVSASKILYIYSYNTDVRDVNITTSTDWPIEYRQSFSREFIKIVNEERESKGLAPFIMDDQLLSAAILRAEEYTGGIALSSTHTRPDGRAAHTVLQDIDYDVFDPRRCGFAECAAMHMRSLAIARTDGLNYLSPAYYAKKFFEDYKNSPEHYAILMKDVDNMHVAAAMSVNYSRMFNVFVGAYN